MPHDLSLIATVAFGFGIAMVLGLLATKLHMPPLVGYLVAGIVVGPHSPGFVADVGLASQLAEIGVMLLMFGVGLHFSLEDLMAVRRIAVPGALVQIVAAVLLGMGVSWFWGWGLGGSLVFGLCLSVASTVVLLRALEAKNLLKSVNGQIAVGWLIVQDLVMVLVLVLLPPLAGVLSATPGTGADVVAPTHDLWSSVGLTLLKVAAFVALMLVVGRRVLPRLLWWVAHTGSRELFTLSVVAVAVGVAYGSSKLFDVSFALGAFFAGMMMRESEFSHRAADESLPLRDAFAVLFFVSVGMLFDPSVVWQQPFKLLAVVLVILVGTPLVAITIVLLFRYPFNTALTVGASLAQIGEFSFILAGMGVALGLMPPEGQSLVLAGALISIALNVSLFAAIDPIRRWLLARSEFARRLELRDDPLSELPMSTDPRLLSKQVVLVGYGRVGRRIARSLSEHHIPYVVAEENRELVDSLRKQGVPAVSGDAQTPEVLIQAHVTRAAMLVIAIPDAVNVRQMVEIARQLNPDIHIVLRTHNEEEAELLQKDTQGTVFLGEHELARGMTEHVLKQLLPSPARGH
ncbi:YbaL family putative K(+) efflux transporter [Hylemonella gracilis]|uniref:Transporter, monovalent cation:proton antiporter-2 (CPA2) family protein n=1 Tax=Hylemonella gracilis ATCC 19624 TaxID=887062 RepID=F3KTS7_9BURK|nr:YbaL family putative K(+) efflux transporter [Hylemonella gracilis]EGI76956.1 transporter, monovalent cation:proton antiporter-2 (CPA2) family protein [Hylemonella gracilis ATCC 19624]